MAVWVFLNSAEWEGPRSAYADAVLCAVRGQPTRFSSIEEFIGRYGGLRTSEEVSRLQADLRPLMLRRVKEDVEKSIPPKEEIVINVELTNLQVRLLLRLLG